MANLNKINKGFWYLITQLKLKRQFKKIGKNTIVFKPMQIDRPQSIEIEDNVFISESSWLMGNGNSGESSMIIQEGTVIGHFSHIIALSNVVIEKNVLLADKVFISDCTHNYEQIYCPIISQGVSILKPVSIGEGSWLGENVCVCGASIGKHCVVGANSVVTEDIPDYSVAVGSPAKVVKKYDFEIEQWVKV